MGGKNRIVVDYGDCEDLILLAAFENKTGNELDRNLLEKISSFKIAQKYEGIKDYKELKNIIKENQEGFVVRFSNGERVKIKGYEYLRLHKIVTGVSSTVIWENLKNKKNFDEILNKVPDEFYNWVQKVKIQLEKEYEEIEKYCQLEFKIMPSRKETAELFLSKKYPQVLFAMLDKKNYEEIIWKLVKPKYSVPFHNECEN